MMHLISEPGLGAEVDKHRAVGINSVYGKGRRAPLELNQS